METDLAQLNEDVARAVGWRDLQTPYGPLSGRHNSYENGLPVVVVPDYTQGKNLTRLLLDAQAAGWLVDTGTRPDGFYGKAFAGGPKPVLVTHPTNPGVALALAITEAAKARRK